MTPISEGHRARFYLYKSKKDCKTFIYIYTQIARHFAKKARQFTLRFYSQKARHFTLRNFHDFMEIDIYLNKKYENFCYVTFLYTKIQTLRKKEDNLSYVSYIQKA